jgi:hypothetical protein
MNALKVFKLHLTFFFLKTTIEFISSAALLPKIKRDCKIFVARFLLFFLGEQRAIKRGD